MMQGCDSRSRAGAPFACWRLAWVGSLATVVVLAMTSGCGNETIPDPHGRLSLPAEPFDYQVELPFYYEVNTNGQSPFQTAAVFNDNTPEDNPITNEGATLGRVIFYDRRLSSTETVSCAHPCHLQELGFSDPEQTSEGVDGHTKRNSMGLANGRFYRQRTESFPLTLRGTIVAPPMVPVETQGAFFWDERAASLEDQVLMPFEDPIEMGLTLEKLVEIVSGQEYYPPLFEAAFGDPEVNTDRIARALAQFIRSIVSLDSRYDEGRRALAATQGEPGDGLQDFPTFTDQENLGKRLFRAPIERDGLLVGPCAGCHDSDAFILPPSGPVNNGSVRIESEEARTLIAEVAGGIQGLDPDEVGPDGRTNSERYEDAVNRLYAWMDDDPDEELGDLGVAEHMDRETRPPYEIALSIGSFKVPSLRNLAETAPYMHDGSLETIEDVIDHYSTGVLDKNHPSINFAFKGLPLQPFGPLRGFEFDEEEKAALVAFLKTLSDPVVLSAEKWSDPFERPGE